ncbi:MAG: hypothetical protein IAE98_04010 [Candidatus Kapabacteria bacterium]|jgi:hypothetical protein|nr:hypothetical protein [Candidatus Kapabacteria bacterium]
MVNKVYSIEEAIEFMNKPNTKVICNSDYCTCGANIVIKKEYNEIINKNIKKLNDFILNKISSFMIID